MHSTSAARCSGVIRWYQDEMIASIRPCWLLGLFVPTASYSLDHRFSIGLKSGDCFQARPIPWRCCQQTTSCICQLHGMGHHLAGKYIHFQVQTGHGLTATFPAVGCWRCTARTYISARRCGTWVVQKLSGRSPSTRADQFFNLGSSFLSRAVCRRGRYSALFCFCCPLPICCHWLSVMASFRTSTSMTRRY